MFNHKEKIDDVLDNFDFEKVAIAMKALRWKYYDDAEYPSAERMRVLAKDLLKGVCSDKRKKAKHASGGFVASKRKNSLSLRFVTEESIEVYEDYYAE
jgi:hypothetical protein